jgi:predicted ATP-grasp superfamily ATP-dependent carboligase
MTGATQRGLSDDELLNEMSQMLDSLLAHFAAVEKGAAKRRR